MITSSASQSTRTQVVLTLLVLTVTLFPLGAARGELDLTLERVGHWGGCSNGVEIVDSLAYVAIGPRLVILDVSAPEEPVFLGQSEPLPDVIMGLCIEGSLAYAVTYYDGLHILDVSVPESITLLGSDNPGINCWGVAALDGYAYAGERDSRLHTYDVHDPAHPTLVDSSATSYLVNEVHLFGGFLYVPTWGGIDIFDISDPEHPVRIYVIPGRFDHLAYDGRLLYGIWRNVLDIWDISDPQQPLGVGHYSSGELFAVDAIAVCNGFAYTSNYDRIYVVDVRDPADPVELRWFPVNPWVQAMTAPNGTLYVANWFYGLATFDLADPTNPLEIGHYERTANAHAIAIRNERAYLTGYRDEVQIIDISNPQEPTRFAQQDLGLSRMQIVDDVAYIATHRPYYAFEIARFNDEDGLDFLSSLPLPSGPQDVAVDGDFAYVVVFDEGLYVIDVSDLEAPVVRGICPIDAPASQRVAVRYPCAYVAAGSAAEWHVVDVSDPDQPFVVRSFPSLEVASSVLVEGDLLIVGRASGFDLYSIVEPRSPVQLGEFSQGHGYIKGLAYANDRVYIAPYLAAVDVSDPTNPRLAGENFRETKHVWDIELDGRYVYAAHDSSGLSVFEIQLVGDFDDDGDVDLDDLAELLASYRLCEGDPGFDPAVDFDDSGCVDLSDLAEFLSHYGNQR